DRSYKPSARPWWAPRRLGKHGMVTHLCSDDEWGRLLLGFQRQRRARRRDDDRPHEPGARSRRTELRPGQRKSRAHLRCDNQRGRVVVAGERSRRARRGPVEYPVARCTRRRYAHLRPGRHWIQQDLRRDTSYRQVGAPNPFLHPRSRPAAVHGGLTFGEVSPGAWSSGGVTTDGSAFCWGRNEFGQLGDWTKEMRLVPVRVLQ